MILDRSSINHWSIHDWSRIDPGPILGRPWFDRGSILDRSRVDLGSILDRSWIDLGSIPDRSWINPGSIQDRCQIDPGSIPNRFCSESESILQRCQKLYNVQKIHTQKELSAKRRNEWPSILGKPFKWHFCWGIQLVLPENSKVWAKRKDFLQVTRNLDTQSARFTLTNLLDSEQQRKALIMKNEDDFCNFAFGCIKQTLWNPFTLLEIFFTDKVP